MTSMSKDMRRIEKELRAQKYQVVATKNGHFTVRKNGLRVATLPGTSSDYNAMKNAIGDLRRAGFKWAR